MKSILTAASVAAALTLASSPALADCFSDMMTKTNAMIAETEKAGDMKTAAEAKQLMAEAQQLYNQGNQDEALVRIVRSMILVDRTQSGGR